MGESPILHQRRKEHRNLRLTSDKMVAILLRASNLSIKEPHASAVDSNLFPRAMAAFTSRCQMVNIAAFVAVPWAPVVLTHRNESNAARTDRSALDQRAQDRHIAAFDVS